MNEGLAFYTICFPAKKGSKTHTMQRKDSILNITYSKIAVGGEGKNCKLAITSFSNNPKFHHQRSPLPEY